MDITIVGTSHIAAQSVTEVSTFIKTNKPDIVAVELDQGRAQSLLSGEQSKVTLAAIMKIGVKGYVFAKIGQYVQKTLGKHVGVAPGSDMKTAILEAQKAKSKVAFIDQPIQITLAKFSKKLTWKERFRFVSDIFKGVFKGKKQLEELGIAHLDLRKVPQDVLIEKMITKVKDRYPNVYETLIEDRNRYMVRALVKLKRKYPESSILAVVGAGHKKGMQELLNKVDFVKIH